MENFSLEIMKQFYLKVLIQGNVNRETAVNVVEKMVKDLKFEALPSICYPKVSCTNKIVYHKLFFFSFLFQFRIVQLPVGEHCIRIWSFNKNDSNSIVTNYYQSGPFTIKDSVIIELLMVIVLFFFVSLKYAFTNNFFRR